MVRMCKLSCRNRCKAVCSYHQKKIIIYNKLFISFILFSYPVQTPTTLVKTAAQLETTPKLLSARRKADITTDRGTPLSLGFDIGLLASLRRSLDTQTSLFAWLPLQAGASLCWRETTCNCERKFLSSDRRLLIHLC